MRTTVNIHDGLLETAKERARDRGVTLGDVVERALQSYLLGAEPETAQSVPPLAVFRGRTGVAPGVDLSTNAGLHEAMFAEEDAVQAGRETRG